MSSEEITSFEILYDNIITIALIGDERTGKSTFLTKLLNKNNVNSQYIPTTVVDFSVFEKVINTSNGNKTIKFYTWDTGGNPKFRSLLSPFCKHSDGILIFFDLTNFQSFKNIPLHLAYCRSTNINTEHVLHKSNKKSKKNCENGNEPTILLIGTKSDLISDREVSPEVIADFCQENELRYMEISSYESLGTKPLEEQIDDYENIESLTYADLVIHQLIQTILMG
ncbi:MAG: GTP-binding protein [Terrestrivirus sp.]|uniref:GTP-binding protein n=1 Tax=Terrestrivirus sp. TaxID=2487775 RepID=A0A3G4ZJZ5_9VIRU|nr:MAG: GTP-binding protein [Terrestrivirus sp.]